MRVTLMVIGLMLWSVTSFGDVIEVSPSEIVSLAADSTGVYRVALKFDLAGMREGAGRKIDAALLKWTVDGVSKDELYGFVVYAAGSQWTAAGVLAGEDAPTVGLCGDESLVVAKEVDGKVSAIGNLNMTRIVREWMVNGNLGLIVSSNEVDATSLKNQIATAKLRVWYGFRGADK